MGKSYRRDRDSEEHLGRRMGVSVSKAKQKQVVRQYGDMYTNIPSSELVDEDDYDYDDED